MRYMLPSARPHECPLQAQTWLKGELSVQSAQNVEIGLLSATTGASARTTAEKEAESVGAVNGAARAASIPKIMARFVPWSRP